MPLDSHNSTVAKATGLIFLLFNIASAREVPFTMPLYIQCILYGLTRALLCVPFIFAHHGKVLILWQACDSFNSSSVIFIELDLVLYNKYSPTSNVEPVESLQHHKTTTIFFEALIIISSIKTILL